MKKLLRKCVAFRGHSIREIVEFVGEVAFVAVTLATVYVGICIACCE